MSEPQQPAVPTDRYGSARPAGGPAPRGGTLGRGARVAIAVALAAAVALTAWFAMLQQRSDPVAHDVVGFDVLGPEEVAVTFQVHMPVGTTATCTVEALAPSYAQVGTLDVPVGPAETRTSAYEVTVGTSQEATSAVVAGCTATGG
ncbi:DUF4307 domain-containing protein [Isoptericola sediminis]|uniref:DUF4307 domain-containing protein n=1 Tax=Isoptericola sediminis TaxID=2733572 RepID=A0A849JVV3_9MICO|nr:DUF4307 domain-containing protein [Isoptericola sediminis]NNU27456.1 DUF4307 domain-containing protein [Isoptericola sediminis]